MANSGRSDPETGDGRENDDDDDDGREEEEEDDDWFVGTVVENEDGGMLLSEVLLYHDCDDGADDISSISLGPGPGWNPVKDSPHSTKPASRNVIRWNHTSP